MPATATETTYETLNYEIADKVCTITLNRPDVYNAFNMQMKKELNTAFKAADRDRTVRELDPLVSCRVQVCQLYGEASHDPHPHQAVAVGKGAQSPAQQIDERAIDLIALAEAADAAPVAERRAGECFVEGMLAS